MAILKNGANGGFSGKVGSVVGYQWKGKDVIRGLPKKSSRPRSPLQLANQQKMKLVQGFLAKVIWFVRIGFRHEAAQRVMSAFNVAMSYNKRNAIIGEYPNLEIDFRKVKVSMGDLPAMRQGEIRWVDDGLHLSWDYDQKKEGQDKLDYALIVIYFPADQFCQCVFNGPNRDVCEMVVPIDEIHMHNDAHVYATFTSYNGERISDSCYLEFV